MLFSPEGQFLKPSSDISPAMRYQIVLGSQCTYCKLFLNLVRFKRATELQHRLSSGPTLSSLQLLPSVRPQWLVRIPSFCQLSDAPFFLLVWFSLYRRFPTVAVRLRFRFQSPFNKEMSPELLFKITFSGYPSNCILLIRFGENHRNRCRQLWKTTCQTCALGSSHPSAFASGEIAWTVLSTFLLRLR